MYLTFLIPYLCIYNKIKYSYFTKFVSTRIWRTKIRVKREEVIGNMKGLFFLFFFNLNVEHLYNPPPPLQKERTASPQTLFLNTTLLLTTYNKKWKFSLNMLLCWGAVDQPGPLVRYLYRSDRGRSQPGIHPVSL